MYGNELLPFDIPTNKSTKNNCENDAISLQKINNICGHLFDGCVVELLDVIQSTSIVVGDKVDGYTFTTETTTATDSM